MASVARRSPADAVGAKSDSRAGSSRSGRLLLRMPAPLHEELSRRAEREDVSLNQLIVRTLSTSVGAAEPPPDERTAPRLLGVALVVNLVVVTLAGVAAVGLLVLAWNAGL